MGRSPCNRHLQEQLSGYIFQREAYRKSLAAGTRGIVITASQDQVAPTVEIPVLQRRKKIKKEVTKVFQYVSCGCPFMVDLLSIPFIPIEMIKVYDGNNSLRRRIFRVITLPRQATTEQVLTSALRAFHITKDPSTYNLLILLCHDVWGPMHAIACRRYRLRF